MALPFTALVGVALVVTTNCGVMPTMFIASVPAAKVPLDVIARGATALIETASNV